jgi:hypothetical protein
MTSHQMVESVVLLPVIVGEELHGMIARRYGAPLASMRDSLYDTFFGSDTGQQLLGALQSTFMADTVHPTAAGFKLYGDIVAYTVRQTLAAALASGAVDPNDSVRAVQFAGGGDLPLPISPVAAQQDADTWCREGRSFQSVAACAGEPSKARSCSWKQLKWHDTCPHDNCRLRGYLLEGNNAALRIGLGRSMLAGANDSISSSAGNCNNTSCVEGYYTGPGEGDAVDFRRRYLAVTYLQGSNIPAKRMAVAYLTCVRGCKCKPIQLTFRDEASTGIAATEVSHD